MGVRYKSKAVGYYKMLKAVESINGTSVDTGVFGEQAWLAGIHEYGCKIEVTPKMRAYLQSQGFYLRKTTKYIVIPERSFLRNGYDENIEKIIGKTERVLALAVEGKVNEDAYFEAVGTLLRSAIQDYANNLMNPPLHPFTIGRKGSSSPLNDSGDMIGAIDYEVKK